MTSKNETTQFILTGKRGEYTPDYLKDSPKKRKRKAKKAFNKGQGWAAKLKRELKKPYFYSLHLEHLNLDPHYVCANGLFRELIILQIKQRLLELFERPFYFKIEVGKHRNSEKYPRLHVHVIAEVNAGLNHLARNGSVVKPVTDFLGLIEYLSKPSLSESDLNESIFKDERRRRNKLGRKRFPRTSGYYKRLKS